MSRSTVAIASLLIASAAHATDVEMVHSGRLLDSFGGPVNGPVSITVSLFDTQASSPAAWMDSFSVTAQDGYFTVVLGSELPLPTSAFDLDTWVEYKIDNIAIGSRKRLGSVPSAAVAAAIPVEGMPASRSCLDAGAMVFDTDLNTVRVCDGTTWKPSGLLASSWPALLTPTRADITTQTDPEVQGLLYATSGGGFRFSLQTDGGANWNMTSGGVSIGVRWNVTFYVYNPDESAKTVPITLCRGDGTWVYVDDSIVIDQSAGGVGIDLNGLCDSQSITVPPGAHRVRVRHFDNNAVEGLGIANEWIRDSGLLMDWWALQDAFTKPL